MIGRPNRVAIIHSCRRWPACPNGASNVRPSPVPNPSREIEKLWTRTWDMTASRSGSDSGMQPVAAHTRQLGLAHRTANGACAHRSDGLRTSSGEGLLGATTWGGVAAGAGLRGTQSPLHTSAVIGHPDRVDRDS